MKKISIVVIIFACLFFVFSCLNLPVNNMSKRQKEVECAYNLIKALANNDYQLYKNSLSRQFLTKFNDTDLKILFSRVVKCYKDKNIEIESLKKLKYTFKKADLSKEKIAKYGTNIHIVEIYKKNKYKHGEDDKFGPFYLKLENSQWKVMFLGEEEPSPRVIINPAFIIIYNEETDKKIIIKDSKDIEILSSKFNKNYYYLTDWVTEPDNNEIRVEYRLLALKSSVSDQILVVNRNGMISYPTGLVHYKGYIMKEYSQAIFALCKKYGLEVNKKENQ